MSLPVRPFLPTTLEEAGNEPLDVILVTGDAYVDHPAFGAALVGRWLEHHGFRVGVLAQPRWDTVEDFRRLGRPRLFFGVTAGNMDSMVNAWTSAGKRRNDDAYTPGGRAGARPDRATLLYTARVKEAYPGVPVVLGGVEASLRRFAHYDFWQDQVRRSILLDAKADILLFGMAEQAVLELARRLAAGAPIRSCRDIPGVAWAPGAREGAPPQDARVLPSHQVCATDGGAFNAATLAVYEEAHPQRGRTLVQPHGDRAVVVNPPAPSLSPQDLDTLYSLPFTFQAHPSCSGPVPALESVRTSVTIHRGCAGGCSFCALTLHQGRQVVSRTPEGILREVKNLTRVDGWTGVVSDLGGATANMFGQGCGSPSHQATCRRLSCLHPSLCRHYRTDSGPFRDLLVRASRVPGVRHVFVGSGLRHDLVNLDPDLLTQVLAHHASGRLTVAPEHLVDPVLKVMGKPPRASFEAFLGHFRASCRALDRDLTLIPYFLAAHPGTGPQDAVDLALRLKAMDIQPRQVQLFLPTPGTLSTAMYFSGMDPRTGASLHVPRGQKERARHRALLLWWKREEAPAIREALRAWGRSDLVGHGPGCLVPPGPVRGGWQPRPEERR